MDPKLQHAIQREADERQKRITAERQLAAQKLTTERLRRTVAKLRQTRDVKPAVDTAESRASAEPA